MIDPAILKAFEERERERLDRRKEWLEQKVNDDILPEVVKATSDLDPEDVRFEFK